MSSEIQKKLAYKEYNQADKIIRYLLNPNDESIDLTATEKKNLDHCRKIHGYRHQFVKKRDIIDMIISEHGVKERHAYNLLNLTEQIFGKVEGVHKDYERNWLLEISRSNIKLAAQGRSSLALTKALMAHYKIVGLDEFVPDMPDFANLEQHQYLINLPAAVVDYLKSQVRSGAVKFTDIMPPPNINLDNIPEAETLPDEPGEPT